MASEETASLGSMVANAPKYFSDSVGELKKITTPTRQETMQATLGTLVIIVFFAVCLVVLDSVCNWIMGLLISA
jgi:preprotein translocase SecE subunit